MKRSRLFEDLGERPYKRPGVPSATEAAPNPRLVTGPRLEDAIPQGKSPIPTTSEKPNQRSNVAIPCTRITTSTALLDVPHTLVWTKCVPYAGTHGAERSLAPSETLASTLAVNEELAAANPADPTSLEPSIRRPRRVLLSSTGRQHPESSNDQWTAADFGDFHVDDPDAAHFDTWRLMGVMHSSESEMDPDSDGPVQEVAVLTHVDGPVTLINDFCERPLVGDFLYVGMTLTGTNERDGSPAQELFYFCSQHVDMPAYQPKQARQAHAGTGTGLILTSGRKRRSHGWTARRRSELRAMRGRVWRLGRVLDSNLMDDRVTALLCIRELSLDEFWRHHDADAPSLAPPPANADDAIDAFVRYAKLIEDGREDGVRNAFESLVEQVDASSTDGAVVVSSVLAAVLCQNDPEFSERLKELLRSSGSSIADASGSLVSALQSLSGVVMANDGVRATINDDQYGKIVAVVYTAVKRAVGALHRALVSNGNVGAPSATTIDKLRHAVEFCTAKLDVVLMEAEPKVHDAVTTAFEDGSRMLGMVSESSDEIEDFYEFIPSVCQQLDDAPSESARALNVVYVLPFVALGFRMMRRSLDAL